MRRGMGVLVGALACLAVSVPSVSAAVPVGWSCVGNDSEAGWTLLASNGGSYPVAAHVPPEGPKVITRWQVELEAGVGPIEQRLEVYKPRSEKYDFEKIGASGLETLVTGVNSFPTRIPASEGNSVGLHGPVATVFCDQEDGAISWLHDGPIALGEAPIFNTALDVGTPVVATVEDDRDGDGYGDESQDPCPGGASFGSPCPITIATSGKRIARGAIYLSVTPSANATVALTGAISWRTGGKGGAARTITAQLASGPPISAAAGSATPFRLALPKAVKKRRARMLPGKKLIAQLHIAVIDGAGVAVDHPTTLRLPGLKPKRNAR